MPVEVNIDFTALGQQIVNTLIEGVTSMVTPLPASFADFVLHGIQSILSVQSSNNVLTHIPVEWTSQNADVLRMWTTITSVAFYAAVTAIVICVHGYRVSRGKEDIFDVLFRTGFLVLLGASLPLWGTLVFNAVNAASDAIGTAPLEVGSQRSPDLVLTALIIVGAIFAVLAWLKGAVGVVFLAVLIVSGPVLLVLSSLPTFSGLGTWWAEEATTWCLRPIMVALVLRLGLGIGAHSTELIAVLFAVVSFWLAWVMDTRIRKFSVGAWGSIGQMQLLRRGAAWAAGLAGGGAPAAVAAAGG